MTNKSILAILDRRANLLNLVAIPFVLLSIYFGLIASDRYTSEAIFTIKETGSSANSLDIGLFSIGGASSFEDERIIKEYLFSSDILEHLDQELDYRSHFQNSGADWYSALAKDATHEEYLEYYQDHVDVFFDEISGLLFVEVQSFEPEYSRELLKTTLSHVETVVNGISNQLAIAQNEFVEKQMIKMQESLIDAKQNLLIFQNKYQIFSPEHQGESLTAIMGGLEEMLSQEQAKLKQLLAFQKADSTQVIVTQERIRALSEQINDENQRLIGEGDDELDNLMVEFTSLQLKHEFAQEAYISTLVSLEQSRAESSKQLKHLVVVSEPTLADEAKYPDRFHILVTALIVLLMIFGIVRMTIITVREHRD